MATYLASVVGWSYLPTFATNLILPYFHRWYSWYFKVPMPTDTTRVYHRNYRWVYALVVLSYLLYNFREAGLAMAPNYYELLAVSPQSDDQQLKVAFRQFAKKYHPDRVGVQGEALFMEIRDAFEALKDPVTRFAYDRFGPQALTWTQCKTEREFIRHGLMQASGFHIVSGCVLVLFSSMGKPSPVSFWRYLFWATLFAYELGFLLSPSTSSPSSSSTLSTFAFMFSDPSSPAHGGLISFLWPNRVEYQHIRFLHALFVLLSVAATRVAPNLWPEAADRSIDASRFGYELQKVNKLCKVIDQEALNILTADMHSIQGPKTSIETPPTHIFMATPVEQPSEQTVDLLTRGMEELIIENRLVNGSLPVRNAALNAIQTKHQEELRAKPAISSAPAAPPPTSVLPPTTPSRRVGVTNRRPMGSPAQSYIRARSQSC